MKRVNSVLILLIISVLSIYGQNTDLIVPEDTALRHGVLPNGLTYFVRKAKGNKCDFRFIQRTGSLVEEDTERGVAHFLEHMLFNGTKHFPGNSLGNYFSGMGMVMGQNFNALTGMESTRYILTGIPVESDERMDSCLLILRDWSDGIVIDKNSLAKERKVVEEERRMYSGREVQDQVEMRVRAGTRYAERNPLGTTESLNSCTAEKMEAFYRRWYQPQNQCVVVAGNFDPDKVVGKIKTIFGDMKRGTATIPDYEVTAKGVKPFVAVAKSKNQPTASINFISEIPEANSVEKNKVAYFLQKKTDEIVFNILMKRINKLKDDNPEIIHTMSFSVPGIKNSVHKLGLKSFTVAADPEEWQSALKSMLVEIEKLKRFGPTGAEVKQHSIVDDYDESADTSVIDFNDTLYVDESDNVNPMYVAENCFEHFIIGSVGVSPKTNMILNKYIENHISRSMIKAAAQRIFDKELCMIQMYMPDQDDVKVPAEDEVAALWNGVADMELADNTVEDVKDEVKELKNYDINPEAGKVVRKEKFKAEKGFTEYTLSNGVKVVLNDKPVTDNTRTEMCMFVKGGATLLNSGEAKYLDHIKSSVRKYDDYKSKISTYNLNGAETLYDINSDSASLEEAFKALYVRLTTTDVDTVEFNKTRALRKNVVAAFQTSPMIKSMFERNYFPYQNYERFAVGEKRDCDTLNISTLKDILGRLHSNYNGMRVVIKTPWKAKKILPYIKKYLGSLPYSKEAAGYVYLNDFYYRTEDTVVKKEFDGEVPKSDCVVYFGWDRGLTYDSYNMAHMDALSHVMNVGLISRIRGKNSDVYSIRVSPSFSQQPIPQMLFNISFSCHPDKEEAIRGDIKSMLKEMAADGVPADLLENYKMMKQQGYVKKDNENKQTKSAFTICRELIKEGINIDRNNPDYWNSITPESLQAFLAQMIASGHFYDYVVNTRPK